MKFEVLLSLTQEVPVICNGIHVYWSSRYVMIFMITGLWVAAQQIITSVGEVLYQLLLICKEPSNAANLFSQESANLQQELLQFHNGRA